MATRSWMHISLAAKCRILFGLAVLVIMGIALIMPWHRMEMLVEQVHYRTARQMALAMRARPEVMQLDQDNAAETLNAWWIRYAAQYELPAPMPVVLEMPPCGDAPPASFNEFQRWVAERMCAGPVADDKGFYRSDSDAEAGLRFRYALPIRDAGDTSEGGPRRAAIFVELPDTDLIHPFWNRFIIIAAGAAAGVAAILVFYLITTRLILSPVRKLRAVADQVYAGDLTVRAKLTTRDEFERLAEAFNRMLTGLQASQNELRTINKSLDVKLGELAEANVALYEADKLKSEFLANVTHELRTPLSSILGFAELLKEAYEDDEARDPQTAARHAERLIRYAANILNSARDLLHLINDLLDLGKIEAGRMDIHHGPVMLEDIYTNLVDLTRPMTQSKKLNIQVEIDDDVPTLNSDAGKIQQILFNLLSNAIKFTPERGSIRLSACTEGTDAVRLVVSDTGPGIPAEQQSVVFEKFRQADGSVTREHAGTGLGLPISRDLAQILGGSLQLTSTPSQGATFTVILPVEAPEQSPPVVFPLAGVPRRTPSGQTTRP